MTKKKRRVFDREFKLEAVRLIIDKGYSMAEVSRNLGVDYSVLRRWKKQFEEDPQFAFPGKGMLKLELLPDGSAPALKIQLEA